MTADVALDAVIAGAVSVTAGRLAYSAQAVGASKIGETKFMQQAVYAALPICALPPRIRRTASVSNTGRGHLRSSSAGSTSPYTERMGRDIAPSWS